MSITCNDCGHVNPNSRITCTQCGKQLPYTPVPKSEITLISRSDAARIMGISKLDIVVSAISLVLAALNIFAAIWVRLDILSHIFVFWLLMLGSVGALALALNSFVPNRTLSAFQARESLHSKHGRDAEPSNLMIGYTKFSNWLTLIINIVALAILGAIFSSSLF